MKHLGPQSTDVCSGIGFLLHGPDFLTREKHNTWWPTNNKYQETQFLANHTHFAHQREILALWKTKNSYPPIVCDQGEMSFASKPLLSAVLCTREK